MPIKILMPALSPTMTEGKLAKWHKKEGDEVSAGDVIAEIETDKATMEVEAVDEGTLGRIVVPEGTEGVKVNAVIALLLEEGEDKAALDKVKIDAPAAAAPAPAAPTPHPAPAAARAMAAAQQVAAAAPPPRAHRAACRRAGAGPRARRATAMTASSRARWPGASPPQAGIDLSAVDGSGPHGRIVKADVERAIAGRRAGQARARTGRRRRSRPSPGTGRPGLSPTCRTPASARSSRARLAEAKQTIPHFYLTVDCEIDALLAARARAQRQRAERRGRLQALGQRLRHQGGGAGACARCRGVNASWLDSAIRRYNTRRRRGRGRDPRRPDHARSCATPTARASARSRAR